MNAASADSCVDHAGVQAIIDQVFEGLLSAEAHTLLLGAQLGQKRMEGLWQAQSTG